MRIGVDLDGVIYDLVGALERQLRRRGVEVEDLPAPTKYHFYEQWGMDRETFYKEIEYGVCVGDLYWKGDPIVDSKYSIDHLRSKGHEVVLITHRLTEGCESHIRLATYSWLAHHRIHHDDLIFTHDKTIHGLDALLDDCTENLCNARDAGIQAIGFWQPWNQDWTGDHIYDWTDFKLRMLFG